MSEREIWYDPTWAHSPSLLEPEVFSLDEVVALQKFDTDLYFRFFQFGGQPFLYCCAFGNFLDANQCPMMPFDLHRAPGLLAYARVPLNVPLDCRQPRQITMAPITMELGIDATIRITVRACGDNETWHCVYAYSYMEG